MSSEIHTPPLIFVTRFSYFGLSGWKSDASKDTSLLFATARLTERLKIFKYITLPTLVMQTDRDFHHYVLSSEELPAQFKKKLVNLCRSALGDRCTVEFKPAGSARKYLREFMAKRYKNQIVAQVILDDDDGLATNFVELARDDIGELAEQGELPYFVSYMLGYGLVATKASLQLFLHKYRFINLGLIMVAPSKAKNILSISHNNAPRRAPNLVNSKTPMFLRSVHDHNDSRVAQTEKWVEQKNWENDPELLVAFPFLKAYQDAL
jgi:hypothetical protein